MAQERLDKLLSSTGRWSRREVKELIRQGRVWVDGVPARRPEEKCEPGAAGLTVDGERVDCAPFVYLMLHKPRGFVTTLSDERGRRTAAELVRGCGARVFPVGRLDRDSEGLLLFTNDGALAQRLLHPSHQVDKVYEVTVTGELTGAAERLASVDRLDGEAIVPAQVRELSRTGEKAVLEVIIHQGKKRQIRRMCAQVGLEVARLKRVAEDGLVLGELPCGHWRYLTSGELDIIKGSDGHE